MSDTTGPDDQRDTRHDHRHRSEAPPQQPASAHGAAPEHRSPQSVTQLVSRSFAPVAGAVYGAGSYVVGYLAIYALVMVDAGANVAQVTAEFGTSTVTLVGWLFYGAHYTPQQISAGVTVRSVNLLSGSTLAIPKLVYFAVPVLLLAGAGALCAARSQSHSGREGAVTGASLVTGYLPLMFVGTFVFVTVVERQSVQLVYGVDTVTALVSGTLMPVLIGGVAGYVVSR